ncbi:unnamed protein product [Bursaphelenchus okinawaensis]|uniref:Major facilitator superfamily (MFS) profile domain-containing protein n=1 Tax=Bursaphelenchus okinawaensis TaxID=465554 RepID=A0A811KW41_9BILA|nr:unnamed protein product [Bursaphelenchus okinawaensis]CAG9114240.1 unnamed protein product [Bursaphelenchus okinawaensis]
MSKDADGAKGPEKVKPDESDVGTESTKLNEVGLGDVNSVAKDSGDKESKANQKSVPKKASVTGTAGTNGTADSESSVAHGSFCLKNKFRHVLMFVALACLTWINGGVTAFNQVILCVKNETTSNPPHYEISKDEEVWLQRAIGIGSLIGTFPFNYAYSRLGAKYFFGGAGVLSGICCCLTPLAASFGFWPFMVIRLIQGFLYSADFSMIGLLISKWSPLNRSALYVSLLTGYTPIASVVTFALSGPSCKSPIGWPIMYYGMGVVTILTFIFWFMYYNDAPIKNKYLSQDEYEILAKGKFKAEMAERTTVPYVKILSSLTIWTVWLNAFSEIVASFFIYAYIGRFHVNVLKFDTHTAGYLAAVPPIPFIILKVAVGYINDRISCCPERIKMIIFNMVTLTCSGTCLIMVGFIPPEYRYVTIATLVIMYICFSFAGGAFYKCAHLAARQYSGFVIAGVQFLKSICLLAVPTVFSLTLRSEEDYPKIEKWRPAFCGLGGLMIAVSQVGKVVEE